MTKANPILELIEHLVTISAGIIAIWGILSWRAQSKWISQRDLVEDILNLLFQYKLNMRRLRSPGGHPNTQEWINRFNEPIFKLESLKYRFAIVFGKSPEEQANIERQLDQINILAANVNIAERRLSEDHKDLIYSLGKMSESFLLDIAKQKDRLEKIRYWDIEGDDEVESKINDVIAMAKGYHDILMESQLSKTYNKFINFFTRVKA